MTLSYPWTFDHERERLRFISFMRRKRRRIDPMLISLAVIVWTLMENGQKGLAGVAILILLGRAYLLYGNPSWLERLSAPKDAELTWPIQTVVLGEEAVETQRGKHTTTLPWIHVTELAETETLFFLCDDDGGAVGVPKSAFEGEEAKAAFVARVEEGLKAGAEAKAKASATLPLGR